MLRNNADANISSLGDLWLLYDRSVVRISIHNWMKIQEQLNENTHNWSIMTSDRFRHKSDPLNELIG